MSDQGTAGIGHNNPPEPISDLVLMLDPVLVREQLHLDFEDQFKRRDELLGGVDRFFETVKTIADDDMHARAADFAQQLKLLHAEVEKLRVIEVKPLDDAKRVIQKELKANLLDRIEAAWRDIEDKMTVYDRARKAAAQKLLLEERQKLQAEADALAKKAQETQRPSLFAEAAKLADKVDAAPVTAKVGVTRGAGSSASLRERYGFELVDLSQVPREWLMLDTARVQRAIDAGLRDSEAGPGIAGGRIVDVSRTVVRRA